MRPMMAAGAWVRKRTSAATVSSVLRASPARVNGSGKGHQGIGLVETTCSRHRPWRPAHTRTSKAPSWSERYFSVCLSGVFSKLSAYGSGNGAGGGGCAVPLPCPVVVVNEYSESGSKVYSKAPFTGFTPATFSKVRELFVSQT